MITGIGTPNNHSNIPLPKLASSLIATLFSVSLERWKRTFGSLGKYRGDRGPVFRRAPAKAHPDARGRILQGAYGVIVVCSSETDQAEIYERLKGEGLTVKVVTT